MMILILPSAFNLQPSTLRQSRRRYLFSRWYWGIVGVVCFFLVSGCATGPLKGFVYTNVKLPLTRDLRPTPLPGTMPREGKVIEIKEPFTGLGFYARVNSNAIGDIAKKNGIETLYFADQQVFSILGVWTSYKVILYGE
jgi:hypothetical protein